MSRQSPSKDRGALLTERSCDGIYEREYRRRDGTIWTEFSVRYSRNGTRARATFSSRAEAV